DQPRPELGHRPDQRRHERPGLVLDSHLPRLGRLGRLLRPRRPPAGRPERVRAPRARPRDQPLRTTGRHRPPDTELRRLRAVHRGRLPERPAPRPEDGRPPGPAPGCPGDKPDPRRPAGRLRLLAAATPTDAAADGSEDGPDRVETAAHNLASSAAAIRSKKSIASSAPGTRRTFSSAVRAAWGQALPRMRSAAASKSYTVWRCSNPGPNNPQ